MSILTEHIVRYELENNIRLQYHIDDLGRHQGDFKHYYEDNTLASLQRYKDGIRHGIQETWYQSGRKKTYTEFFHGVMHGKSLVWYDKDGEIPTIECEYYNGKRHGKAIERTSDGIIVDISYYSHGFMHGLRTVYRDTGRLYSQKRYVNGDHFGEYKEWANNGDVRVHQFVYKDKFYPIEEVSNIVSDINNVTKEEEMLLRLKFGA